MEVNLNVHNNQLSCRRRISSSAPPPPPFSNHLRIIKKPFSGFFPNARISQISSCCNEYPAGGVLSLRIVAGAADFSRRRPKKMSSARSKGPSSKGFGSKTQVETGNTQKKDQRNNVDKEGSPSIPTSSGYAGTNQKTLEVIADIDNAEQHGTICQLYKHDGEKVGSSSLSTSAECSGSNQKTLEVVADIDIAEQEGEMHQQYKHEGKKEGSNMSTSSEYAGSNQKTLEVIADTDNAEQQGELHKQYKDKGQIVGSSSILTSNENAVSKQKTLEAIADIDNAEQLSEIHQDYKDEGKKLDDCGAKDKEIVSLGNSFGAKHLNTSKGGDVGDKQSVLKFRYISSKYAGSNLKTLEEVVADKDNVEQQGEIHQTCKDEGEKLDGHGAKDKEIVSLGKSLGAIHLNTSEVGNVGDKKSVANDGESTVKLLEEAQENEIDDTLKKLEKEARLRKELIEALAEKKFCNGNKMFVYPEVVNPDQDIEVFINRSLSTLYNEPDIMIMGAFNDWRWKSFTMKLDKTHLRGDWWSCRVHVPKEAYKMDFVFFSQNNVFDNNDKQDFCITVEGGMDAYAFEEFLLEEKRRELQKLAEEQAERVRKEEEERRKEEEKAAKVADRVQARMETEKRREVLQLLIQNATLSVDNVWFIEPAKFKGGDTVRLFYNRSSGPLARAEDIWVHGGKNNWEDGLSIVERFFISERKDGDWWYTQVDVPDGAVVLDWVLADGPPGKAVMYDNNGQQDFHAIVPGSIPEGSYWVKEEEEMFIKLQEDRRLKAEAMRAKAEKTAKMKSEMKEKTLKTYLLSQKNVVYTEPLKVQAGDTVTVFYNPSNTVLNGKTEVWFRGSFNHWTHRMGPLAPQRMVPAQNGSHVQTTVKVPLDAYMMDFVFSEREDGGIFDNKNGMDYHIPISGGIVKEPPLHIVHVAVEMAPIAKVGGLGDVVTSLSRAVQDLNHTVDIILPKYDCMKLDNVKDLHCQKSYYWSGTEIKVWFGKVEGLSVYFLEPQNGMFWAGCIYGCKNDGERFGFFCHAALEFLHQNESHPDIIHCHDWSSAPVAWLFKDEYMQYGLNKTRIVFTIHNLEFGAPLIGKAMAYCDKATTVSHTYSKEVAGNSVIAPHLYKFHGILNGIDPDIWDPYNDKFIPVSYTADNVVEGKKAAKVALQERLGLEVADLPLVGIITRLTHQKGIHLIKHAIWRTLERNGQVVLLGSAPDPRIQNDFINLANELHSKHNARARLILTYDEPLSHLIYAASDFILVPSIFEPCGLTQLTAMRFGSIPVVRKTGGLYDTVFDVDNDKGRAESQGLEPNGFNFDGADAPGVDYALNRAISAWYDGREWFNSLCKRVMEQDWSWNRPALDYLELYHAARK